MHIYVCNNPECYGSPYFGKECTDGDIAVDGHAMPHVISLRKLGWNSDAMKCPWCRGKVVLKSTEGAS